MQQVQVPSDTHVHRLVQVSDALLWVLLTTPVPAATLMLKPVDCDTTYFKVYEAHHGLAQVGWVFEGLTPRIRHTGNSLMAHTSAFSKYTLKTLSDIRLEFALRYKMPDWQYLTCGSLCSVILAVPPLETCERFDQ